MRSVCKIASVAVWTSFVAGGEPEGAEASFDSTNVGEGLCFEHRVFGNSKRWPSRCCAYRYLSAAAGTKCAVEPPLPGPLEKFYCTIWTNRER